MDLKRGHGVPDFVLMDTLSEDAMFENITIRFKSDEIYTYIGDVIVSVNPFKKLNIYNAKDVENYRGRYKYERTPHIFAVANDAYRSMCQNHDNQCIIISGESGAGKTEASKIVMTFVAHVSKSGGDVETIKDKLLQSNPILESFGNAKTLRNDNSSRFGKYMELQFAPNGLPKGGKITNYLLEKSRVVNPASGERNFHIFYHLLSADSSILKPLNLQPKEFSKYNYLSVSNCFTVSTINDQAEFKTLLSAMKTLNFSVPDQEAVWKVLSSILHIGNITFDVIQSSDTGQETVKIKDMSAITSIAKILQCEENALARSLTSRSITTAKHRSSVIRVLLDHSQAIFSRDALSKALYERLFDWIVKTINTNINDPHEKDMLKIGVLDIYGFEIFDNNSFEQFCINLCNEKLQQLFIELTLKSEQEEYVKEGIEWTPIKYFDNKTICELIEKKPIGIISLLDEACLLAKSTDATFLETLNKNFGKHNHYASYGTTKNRAIGDSHFTLKHYAGDVTYNVIGFLEKNKDTLFQDLKYAMTTSSIPLLQTLFPKEDQNAQNKRPTTAGTQFRTAVNELIQTLLACSPHYIRCIKSNDEKKSGILTEDRVRHQIRYLGLLENVRVRRAGFANRQTFQRFFNRYKMLCKQTWPSWNGDLLSGVKKILSAHNIQSDQYRLGKTKIFIRDPKTLFYFEEKREIELPRIAIIIQTAIRGYMARNRFAEKKAATYILWFYRKSKCGRWFNAVMSVFANVSKDPNFGKGANWPVPPKVLTQASDNLKKIHARWRAMKMIMSLSEDMRSLMRQKVTVLEVFGHSKPWDVKRNFEGDYLEKDSNPLKEKYVSSMQQLFQKYGDTQINFADYVYKVNRKCKLDKRAIVVTEKNIYKNDPKNYKVKKYGYPIVDCKSISLSTKKDTYVVVHAPEPKRDIIIDLGIDGQEKVSEFVCVVVEEYKRLTGQKLKVEFNDRIKYNNSRDKGSSGKDHFLTFQSDPKLQKGCTLKKDKEGAVVSYSP